MTNHDLLSPIPAMATATDPIHSAADLRQRWRALVGELGFGERLLRFVFIGSDHRMIKMLSEHPIGKTPQPAVIRHVMALLADVIGEGPDDDESTVAFLLTRPGRGPVTTEDRDWCTLVTQTAAEFEVPLQPFFRANDENLVLVEPDQVR
jgi:hypothetical protein